VAFYLRSRTLPRRSVLRAAGSLLPLPFLDAMRGRRARASDETPSRFVALFMPNGTDPSIWQPKNSGPLNEATASPALADLGGFGAEQPWPAAGALFSEVTALKGLRHDGVCKQIHNPSLALCAHNAGSSGIALPPKPTLDQVLADRIAGDTPFRTLAISGTSYQDAQQGFISYRANKIAETPYRDPSTLFDALFGGGNQEDPAAQRARRRRGSILDFAREDATRLAMRLGKADNQRLDAFLTSVRELEMQLDSGSVNCAKPEPPAALQGDHAKFKQLIDLSILALACDLTRVVTLHYDNSWSLNFKEYDLGDGVGDWSDHFISHKLGDRDRATDLDGLPKAEALAIANARVLQTSRFKVRRFAYLVDRLASTNAASGRLLDESLLLYTSEHGNGDSHERTNMPVLLAGRAGGHQPGRVVDATDKQTGALHATILNRMGVPTESYGDPVQSPIPGL